MKVRGNTSITLETNTLDKEKAPRTKAEIRADLVFALNRFIDTFHPEDCKSVEIRLCTQSYAVDNNDDDDGPF